MAIKFFCFEKKGFVFTVFVITALALMLMLFRIKIDYTEEEKANIYSDRIEQTNTFIDDMIRDSEWALYASSYRAIIGANEFIYNNSVYINNTGEIAGLIINGTINGTKIKIMEHTTFNDWTDRMKLLAKKFNINISLYNVKINVSQSDAWTINVTMNYNVNIIDFDNTLGWNMQIEKMIYLDLGSGDFPDPMYYVESKKNYKNNIGCTIEPCPALTNKINMTPYNVFWIDESGYINIANLSNHTSNQYYAQNNNAPSYLMRLMGDFGPGGDLGIESFVNVLEDPLIFDYSNEGATTCATDYQLFTGTCVQKHEITNMNPNFVLDTLHLNRYNLIPINTT